jgi:hypothetical protein
VLEELVLPALWDAANLGIRRFADTNKIGGGLSDQGTDTSRLSALG